MENNRPHSFIPREPRFPSREEAKKAGYFSRSYETSVPQTYAKHSFAHQEKRKISAELCAEQRAKRSPKEQLDFLDYCIGKGKGARRERDRLNKMIKEARG